MGLWDALKGEVRRNFIARADSAKGELVYKYPDSNIRKGTEITVEADECALFFRDGTIRGTLGPGRHTLTSDNIPFLGMLIDAATGGNLYVSEVYFVTTREMPSVKFGGPIGDLQDPQSGLVCSTTVFGEFSVRVSSPEQFVVGFVGLRKQTNDEILAWFKQLFLRTIKDAIAELIVKQEWPLLKVTSGAYTEEICEEAVRRSGPHIGKYGLEIVHLANFHVSIKEEDSQRLKKLAETGAMSRMAGGYQNYAMGEAMMRGGSGGGGGSGGMDMMGMMMAQQMMQQMMANQGKGAQGPAAAPMTAPAAAPVEADPVAEAKAKLQKIKSLLDDGLITQEEFNAKKAEILARL
jgi:membrane protease subunit (stomatin/prohibitin family)